MKMIKNIAKWAGIGAVAVAASSVQASPINVGGVVWDPEAVSAFPTLTDFRATTTVFETFAVSSGDVVTGFGLFERINSGLNNQSAFCPGCELTFTFTMELVSFSGLPSNGIDLTDGVTGTFDFKDLDVNVFVDHTADFAGTLASASDGTLWLSAVGANNLTGTGSNLGTGSATGTGSALLNVDGGLAFDNFNTNGEVGGADLAFVSSFGELDGQILEGSVNISGDTIPAPGTIALLGLGLLGLGSRKYLKK